MGYLKRVNKIGLMLVLVFAMCVCNTACGNKEKNSEDKSEKITATELPENEIIFIKTHRNWYSAYEYVERGYFVDSSGDAYAFDFSRNQYEVQNDEEAFLDKLQIVRDITEPFGTVDIELLKEIYYYGMEMDVTAEYSEEAIGCDMGQTSFVFHNTDTDACTIFYEDGDFRRELQDAAARHLVTLEEQMQDDLIVEEYPLIQIYSANDTFLTSFDCGYVENEGKYIIFNEEQLSNVEEYTGYQFSDNFDFDAYVYFVQFQNVPSTGYDLKASAIVYYDNAFEIVESGDSVVPGPDDVVGEVMGGFCFIAAFPKEDFPDSENNYKDFSGDNWMVPEE